VVDKGAEQGICERIDLQTLDLLREICALREALEDIAIGIHDLGILSKDNMRRRALEALK
jgi:hypothetical protein